MSKINIRESLRNMDADSCCKYDLLTMYDACPLTDEDKADIAKLLFDNEDPEVIYQKLCTYFCDDDVSELTGLTDVQNVTPFEAITNNVKMGLDQKYDSVFYNDVAGQFEIKSKDTTYTFGLSPVEYETDGISLYVDYNYDMPINYTSIKEASEDILNKCNEKVSTASKLNDYADDDTMEYTVYDVVEDGGRLCAKCMNESTNSFEDIKLGKVSSDAVNKLLNNILNNPNYKLTDDCKRKIANNSAPWGIVMSPSFDITASNALMSTGDFGGSVSFGESEQCTFENGDRVTDGDRKGTVIDCDSIKVLVDWDYSETDDIEWVSKDELSFVNSLKENTEDEKGIANQNFKNKCNDSDRLIESYVSGRYVWFNYDDIKDVRPAPKQIIDAYNIKYPNYSNPLVDIQQVEFTHRNYAEKELHYLVTDNQGNKFWAIVGNVPEDKLRQVLESHNDDLGEDFDVDDIVTSEQEFSSAATSINSTKLPAIYNMVNFRPGAVVVDFGGGKFDNAVNYLKDKDVTLLVYDPYNRSAEHNKEVLRILKEHGGADAAVNSNVLNVIKEPEAREAVLRNIKKITKRGAPIYITVYEGRGDGAEGPTKSGYQLNRKTSDYMDEIGRVFSNVKRKGKLITAINESTNMNESIVNDASNIGQGYTAPNMVSLVTKAKELEKWVKEYKNSKDKDAFERLLPSFEDNILNYKSEIEEKIKDFDKYWEVHKRAMLDNISEAVSILKNIGIPRLDSKLSKLNESYPSKVEGHIDLNKDIVFIADACDFDPDTMEPRDTINDVEVTMPDLISAYGENVVEIAMLGVTRQAVKKAGGIPSNWDIGHLINNIASKKFHEANPDTGFLMGHMIEVERMDLLPDAIELMQNKLGDMLLPTDEGLEEALSELSHMKHVSAINSSKISKIDESYSGKDVEEFLDEVGGFTDYDGKVEALMNHFGMTKDEAESAIQDYVIVSDDDLQEIGDALYDVPGIQEVSHSDKEEPDNYIIIFANRGDADKREKAITSALKSEGMNATCTAVNGSNVFEYHITRDLQEECSAYLNEGYSDDDWVDKMREAFQGISGIKDISEGKNSNTYVVTFDTNGSVTARARVLLKALIKANLDIELDSTNGSNVFTFVTPTSEWEFIKGKMIKDSDGFLTSYDWYRNTDSGLNIFMFGADEADPDYADWETESDSEAKEWFNSYKGFDEEEID